jgi:CDP-glycerol glycerophosphotransferase (TagB/SpsB family)
MSMMNQYGMERRNNNNDSNNNTVKTYYYNKDAIEGPAFVMKEHCFMSQNVKSNQEQEQQQQEQKKEWLARVVATLPGRRRCYQKTATAA